MSARFFIGQRVILASGSSAYITDLPDDNITALVRLEPEAPNKPGSERLVIKASLIPRS